MSTSSEAAAAAFGIGVAPSTLRRRRTGGGGLRAERSDKAGSSLQVGRGRTGLRREEPVHRLRLGRARATSGHDLQRELDAIRGETAEVYGFVGWLVTSTAFVGYLLWAFVPENLLIQAGITYYPDKYLAVAIPAWLVVCFLTWGVLYTASNLMLTPSRSSYESVEDAASFPLTDRTNWAEAAEGGTPDLADLPLTLVNRVMHPVPAAAGPGGLGIFAGSSVAANKPTPPVPEPDGSSLVEPLASGPPPPPPPPLPDDSSAVPDSGPERGAVSPAQAEADALLEHFLSANAAEQEATALTLHGPPPARPISLPSLRPAPALSLMPAEVSVGEEDSAASAPSKSQSADGRVRPGLTLAPSTDEPGRASRIAVTRPAATAAGAAAIATDDNAAVVRGLPSRYASVREALQRGSAGPPPPSALPAVAADGVSNGRQRERVRSGASRTSPTSLDDGAGLRGRAGSSSSSLSTPDSEADSSVAAMPPSHLMRTARASAASDDLSDGLESGLAKSSRGGDSDNSPHYEGGEEHDLSTSNESHGFLDDGNGLDSGADEDDDSIDNIDQDGLNETHPSLVDDRHSWSAARMPPATTTTTTTTAATAGHISQRPSYALQGLPAASDDSDSGSVASDE